jgi:hypothetical protein
MRYDNRQIPLKMLRLKMIVAVQSPALRKNLLALDAMIDVCTSVMEDAANEAVFRIFAAKE